MKQCDFEKMYNSNKKMQLDNSLHDLFNVFNCNGFYSELSMFVNSTQLKVHYDITRKSKYTVYITCLNDETSEPYKSYLVTIIDTDTDKVLYQNIPIKMYEPAFFYDDQIVVQFWYKKMLYRWFYNFKHEYMLVQLIDDDAGDVIDFDDGWCIDFGLIVKNVIDEYESNVKYIDECRNGNCRNYK